MILGNGGVELEAGFAHVGESPRGAGVCFANVDNPRGEPSFSEGVEADEIPDGGAGRRPRHR